MSRPLDTREQLQSLANAYRILRYVILYAITVQMFVNWGVPMLFGGASESQRQVIGLSDPSGLGAVIRTALGLVAMFIGFGHGVSIFLPRIQTVFGALHAVVSVGIGIRMMEVDLIPAGITYALAWGALGVAVAVTADRRKRRADG